MKVVFFAIQTEFRNWLEIFHKKEKELIVGFYKVNSGKASMTWSQSVDEALCYGWIDGVRKSINNESYCIRFTPRKATSIWSAVNINKVEMLINQGLMQDAGLLSYNKLIENKCKIYGYENEEVSFSPDFEKKFKANKTAWKYYQNLAPSYRKLSSNWVMSAKQESTQQKRLNELIADSELGTNKWKNSKYNS